MPVSNPSSSVPSFEYIGEATLTGDAATITVTGIATTYKELLIFGRIIHGDAGAGGEMRFNGDTGNNYMSQFVRGANAAASADAGHDTNGYDLMQSTSTGDVSTLCVHVYAPLATITKTFTSECMTDGGAAANNKSSSGGGVWNNTADSITSVTFAGQFLTGSRIVVFGYKG